MKKIALEEHFLPPGFDDYFESNLATLSRGRIDVMKLALADLGEVRLKVMDDYEIEFAILSVAGPGVQIERDGAVALRRSQMTNDYLAREIQNRPARYGGFAHLAMQDALGATEELERCVRDLGFKGAMINGHTGGVYLDSEAYFPFWERVETLGVPIYIHPGNPADHPAMYSGRPEIKGAVWGWAVETATHALRLVFGGVFDRYPGAQIILGHMGETLPFSLWRFDSRHHNSKLKHKPSYYIRNNMTLTTSGVCSDASLRCAIDALGSEQVMFSVDYPFEDTKLAAAFIEHARLTKIERAQVCHGNAMRVLSMIA